MTPHPTVDRLARVAVVLAIVGLLCLSGVLVQISAFTVGLFMAGSGLVVLAVVLYVAAVVFDLRRGGAL